MKRLNDKIELGVSLYSLTSEFVTGKMILEDCLKTVSEMGFKGVEIVAAQTVPEYPNPSDKWLFEFSNLLAKYGLTPVCYSAYIDNGLRPDRDLNRDEIVSLLTTTCFTQKPVSKSSAHGTRFLKYSRRWYRPVKSST